MKALITGITGQDGSYLAELLLFKGYEVHGMVRRSSTGNLWRIEHILKDIQIHSATLENYPSICKMVHEVHPDECYHLAAQSSVPYAFDDSFSTMQTNINGTHFLLEAIKSENVDCRFYFAGSSEMFGEKRGPLQSESTPFSPRSAYGISKAAGFHLTKHYREAYGLPASCGILFNHESPRRGNEFVTQKIAKAAKARRKVTLGNLNAKRDWGHAKEYVKAMWLMLQHKPGEYVVATGEMHSVSEFAALAFQQVGLDYHEYVESDPRWMRPSDIESLCGDASRAETELGWRPVATIHDLVREMVNA